jgi:hypothetical protein
VRVCFLDFDGVLNTQPWIASVKTRHSEPWPGGQAPSWEDPDYEAKREAWFEEIRTNEACLAWSRKHDLAQINPDCVRHLNTIVEKTGCSICISSSWRILHSVEYLTELLCESGLKYPKAVIGKTPGGGGYRGPQIQSWIREWNLVDIDLQAWIRSEPNPVNGIVIIDDDGDLEPYLDWHVKTNFFTGGLSAEHAEKAVEILMRPFSEAV